MHMKAEVGSILRMTVTIEKISISESFAIARKLLSGVINVRPTPTKVPKITLDEVSEPVNKFETNLSNNLVC